MNSTKSSDATETAHVGRALAGDGDAWAVLVRHHQDPVFRLAYLILGDADEAEDVAQDVFIRAHRKLHQFDMARPLRPWLLGITSNLARNRLRSFGRYMAALRRFWQTQPPHTTLPQNDDSAELYAALQKLTPASRETVYLRYFLELSEVETADALGIAPGTVKSRLHRALKQLRVLIEMEQPHARQ
ncbi:MAG: RNA polymerase sigma factor [Anaerolineae bacterium]|nr:RNA polymerase sigma factor [Anaerolineae bacterium]